MKKTANFLIYAGLAIVAIALTQMLFGYLSLYLLLLSSYRYDSYLWLFFAGTIVLLAQIVLIIARKYDFKRVLLWEELALLVGYLVLTLSAPGTIDGIRYDYQNLFPAPSLMTAKKQIQSCEIKQLYVQYVEVETSEVHLQYKNDRNVTLPHSTWPELKALALSDPGHCGYQDKASFPITGDIGY